MCLARLREYRVSPETPGEAALLAGYRLCFNKPSAHGSGKANLERDPSGEVWGVLYTIRDDGLKQLDRGEKGYARHREVVRTAAGVNAEAWVFVATAPAPDLGLRPYGWYKRLLVEGAGDHILPGPYINSLEGIESVDDPDAARDARWQRLKCDREG